MQDTIYIVSVKDNNDSTKKYSIYEFKSTSRLPLAVTENYMEVDDYFKERGLRIIDKYTVKESDGKEWIEIWS